MITIIMWRPVDEPWQYRLLDMLPPSIDQTQLDQARAMTPTQRIEAMIRLNEMVAELTRARRASSGIE